MEATNPITERHASVTRQHARRPQTATLRLSTSAANEDARPASRSQVLDAFRDMAHGIAAPIAEEMTRAFYRASGQAWAHSLTEQGGNELSTRVADAFRAMAHGVPAGAAHAQTIEFFRSGGQRWAANLG